MSRLMTDLGSAQANVKLLDGNGIGAAIMIRESFAVPIVFCSSYAATGAVQAVVGALGKTALNR